ncbi:MAG: TlpA family protein disulfide reductase [Phycisphaerales bacterium]|nr:MAG: TlpA family protein disulfide reductase [Phycisphaerales bacterium]
MSMTVKRMTLFIFLVAYVAPAAAGPEIGDSPPPLVISEWVKGDPVDLQREIGKRVYMVEFWATWCPPCKMSVPLLTELQHKYSKDLTIIGVTAIDEQGNTRKAIRRFVKRQGASMEYHVAIDKGMATWNRYMGTMAGIPHAFVVGREGKIMWQGSPLDPALDGVLAGVISGTYDMEAAQTEAEINSRLQALNFAMQLGHWSVVWDLSVGILKLDPDNDLAMDYIMGMYLDGLKEEDSYRRWVRSHIKANRNDVKAMGRLAMSLSSNPNITKRTPDLALEAALAAHEATKNPDPLAIAAYAQAVYQIGMVDRAIELQKEAIAVADGDVRKELQGVLDYYHLCRELQAKVR